MSSFYSFLFFLEITWKSINCRQNRNTDTKQDSRWVMNAMEIISNHLQSLHRYQEQRYRAIMRQIIITPNYRDFCLSSCRHTINLQRISFFEAGEGKSLFDRHFAIVRHSIREKIKLGQSFERVEDIIDAVRALSGVHCYSLVPNRIIEVPVF